MNDLKSFRSPPVDLSRFAHLDVLMEIDGMDLLSHMMDAHGRWWMRHWMDQERTQEHLVERHLYYVVDRKTFYGIKEGVMPMRQAIIASPETFVCDSMYRLMGGAPFPKAEKEIFYRLSVQELPDDCLPREGVVLEH